MAYFGLAHPCEAFDRTVTLYGQRWQYNIGNTEINVDNAFSVWGWAQERLLVNSEVTHTADGWFIFRRSFREPWLTILGDGVLGVRLKSKLKSVSCEVTIDGKAIEPDAIFKAVWDIQGAWPNSDDWIETHRRLC